MRRSSGLLTVGAVLGFFVACSPYPDTSAVNESTASEETGSESEEVYAFVPSTELALEIQDFYYNGAVAEDGVAPNGGEVGKLLCLNKPIELASPEFEDGFIATKDFGKIKLRFSSSLTSEEYAVFLTPNQKRELKKFCSG